VAATFSNGAGAVVIRNLITMMKENRAYLSEVDGAIGDGDHGINMSKGFTMAGERITEEADFATALKTLGRTLLMEIGGSMGPLYGGFFKAMSKEVAGEEEIDAAAFGRMLEAGYAEIRKLGDAKVGDKTLVDALDPAVRSFQEAVNAGRGFGEALQEMSRAAEAGKDSTKDMVAKVGRSARLGERSRGVLDAGATSCYLILSSMADSIQPLLGAA